MLTPLLSVVTVTVPLPHSTQRRACFLSGNYFKMYLSSNGLARQLESLVYHTRSHTTASLNHSLASAQRAAVPAEDGPPARFGYRTQARRGPWIASYWPRFSTILLGLSKVLGARGEPERGALVLVGICVPISIPELLACFQCIRFENSLLP